MYTSQTYEQNYKHYMHTNSNDLWFTYAWKLYYVQNNI